MKLYLDDIRPAPDNTWTLCRTVDEAKLLLETGEVEAASLDHDLGACEACMHGLTVDEWLRESHNSSMPHCSHVGTGMDLVKWMHLTGLWPKTSPKVHSANPVGAHYMRDYIARYWGTLMPEEAS